MCAKLATSNMSVLVLHTDSISIRGLLQEKCQTAAGKHHILSNKNQVSCGMDNVEHEWK